jgi:hypothetical protein
MADLNKLKELLEEYEKVSLDDLDVVVSLDKINEFNEFTELFNKALDLGLDCGECENIKCIINKIREKISRLKQKNNSLRL